MLVLRGVPGTNTHALWQTSCITHVMFVKSYRSIRCYPRGGIKVLVLRACIRYMGSSELHLVILGLSLKHAVGKAQPQLHRGIWSGACCHPILARCLWALSICRLTRAITSTSRGHISPPELRVPSIWRSAQWTRPWMDG